MSWYQIAKKCVALRKHQMRVDMRVYCGEITDFTNPNEIQSAIKSTVTTAIMKGLDVIGVVSNIGPQIGWEALKLVKKQNLDVYVVPGEEYQCIDKTHLLVYLLKKSMPPSLNCEQAITHARKNGGFVMIAKLTARQSQWLERVKGQLFAPQAVELYADDYRGYTDSHLDESYQCFVNSGARTANALEKSTGFTIIDREDLEGIGIIPEDEGEQYEPDFVKHDQEIKGGESPAQVAGLAPATAPSVPQKR